MTSIDISPGAIRPLPLAAAPEVAHYRSPIAEGLDLPFSEAVTVGDLIFLSGQLGNRPGTPELVPGGIEAEARQTMENIGGVLEAVGSSFDRVVKCTIMLADIGEWAAFNAVYVTYFERPFPARSAFATGGLALGARVEVECIARR
ncbi:MAG: Rid family detoxifying hydrolase [Pseudomonadota bacterium]